MIPAGTIRVPQGVRRVPQGTMYRPQPTAYIPQGFNAIIPLASAIWSAGRRVNPSYGGSIADISGGNFTTIYDQAGSRNATGTATVGTGTIGGLNYPKFNGTSDQLAFTDLTLTTFEVWAAVGVPTAMTNVGPIIGSATSSCSWVGDGAAQMTLRSVSNSTSDNIINATPPGIQIMRLIVDPVTTGKFFIEINNERNDPTGRTIPAGVFTFNRIGRRGTSAIFGAGGMCEVIVFPTLLSSAQATDVYRNMASFWRKGLYVDQISGNDSNLGWNEATPFMNATAVTSLVLRAGAWVYFNKGTTQNRQALKLNTTGQLGTPTDPVMFGAYGTGADPIFDGGTPVSGSAMTLVSGTEFKTTVALTSPQCTWANSPLLGANYLGDNELRLTLGTAGALTWTPGVGSPGDINYSPPVGQWAYTAGELHVNVGQDPTTMNFSVADELASQTSGFNPNKNYIGAQGLVFQHWPYDGVSFANTGGLLISCTSKYNANDGCGGTPVAATIIGGIRAYNGQGRVPSGPAGDGDSFHGSSSATITGSQILFNDKAGFDHQDGATVLHNRCYVRGNNRNIYLASIGGGGTQTWTNVQVVRENNDGLNTVEFDVAANNVIQGSTIVNLGASLNTNGIVINGTGTSVVQDCITDGHAVGLRNTATGGLTHDHNDHHDTAAYAGTTAGTGDITGDPLFVNRAAANFILQPSSPCIGAGVALAAVPTDYTGATRANPPSMGAYEA